MAEVGTDESAAATRPTSCVGCGGRCCELQRWPPYGKAELQGLPIRTKDKLLAGWYHLRSLGELPGPCLFLDVENGYCGEYECRPRTCRDFEVGGEACMRARDPAQNKGAREGGR